MVASVDEGGAPAGRPSRTTYLSELLAPVERLVDLPSDPEPETRLVAMSWAFAVIAVAALIVCGLIVFDVARSGGSPATMSPSTVSQGPAHPADAAATGR